MASDNANENTGWLNDFSPRDV